MPTIEHADGSNTSIEQDPDGSWTVVTTDAYGGAGATHGYGSNWTEKELTDRLTYPNDIVASSSVDHADGSSTVIDQLASGGWSVYSVDSEGNQGSSREFGSNYTFEELAAQPGAVDATTAQLDLPAADLAPPDAPAAEPGPGPADAPAPDTSAQAAAPAEVSPGESSTSEVGEGGAKGDDSGPEQEGAEGQSGKVEEGTGG